MYKTAISQFRLIGFIEGLSLIFLLFVAMPLKYWAGFPEAVTLIGSLHGVLFMIYLAMIAYVTLKIRWSLLWITTAVAVAFIPFGNLFLDAKLRKASFN
jgi:integral membrane protein